MTDELPPLPEPAGAVDIDCGQAPGGGRELVCVDGYTADQMQAYARAAIAAHKAKQTAEPVAFRSWDDENSQWSFTLWPDEWKGHPNIWEPLYTHPAPKREPFDAQQVITGFCNTPHQTHYVAVFEAGVRFAEGANEIKKAP